MCGMQFCPRPTPKKQVDVRKCGELRTSNESECKLCLATTKYIVKGSTNTLEKTVIASICSGNVIKSMWWYVVTSIIVVWDVLCVWVVL